MENEIYTPLGETSSEPDLILEFSCGLNLIELKMLIMGIGDGHVMYETIMLSEQYTGERTYSGTDPRWSENSIL